MESLLTLIICTIPGFLSYFWINLFGITASSKNTASEITIFSALLWVPIIAIILCIYNFFAWVSSWAFLHPKNDIIIFKKNWAYIIELNNLINKSENIWFIVFYFISAIITSFLLAWLLSAKGYPMIRSLINRIRKSNKMAPLSVHSTVWDETFLNDSEQIIKICKPGEDPIIGLLKRVPRQYEPSKSLVLEATEYWYNVMDYYNVEIDHTFTNLDNGLIIHIYNTVQAHEASNQFNQRFPEGRPVTTS